MKPTMLRRQGSWTLDRSDARPDFAPLRDEANRSYTLEPLKDTIPGQYCSTTSGPQIKPVRRSSAIGEVHFWLARHSSRITFLSFPFKGSPCFTRILVVLT